MLPTPFGPEEFKTWSGADSATLDRFFHYHQLLIDWNARINLVADSTLQDIWLRHFMDSAQLLPLLKPMTTQTRLADLGSGAGFPGLVLALMGVKGLTLVERDTRKAAFLRTVVAQTGVAVDILNLPIEAIEDQRFDFIVSRALASVGDLLDMSEKIRGSATVYLLLKGRQADGEVQEARRFFDFDLRRMTSETDSEAVILRLAGVKTMAAYRSK